jgi:hypothetical protein
MSGALHAAVIEEMLGRPPQRPHQLAVAGLFQIGRREAAGHQQSVNGTSLEIHGVDRYVLRDGRGVVGRAYFDPRPFIEAVATGER